MIIAKRIRILRVVTTPECVVWHMGKTLELLSKEFCIGVAGECVSNNKDKFINVSWYDIGIPRKIHPVKDFIALIKLCLVCYRFRPDIIHSIMPKAGLLTAIAAWLMRVPVRMHTFTGQVWDTKFGLSRKFYKFIDRLIVSLNTRCLTDSHSQSQHLFDSGIGFSGSPLPVLGLGSLIGVDLDRFDVQSIASKAVVTRDSLGISENDFVIAYIARKTRDKGAVDMLRGFQLAKTNNPNMRLLFIGPDESGGELDLLRITEPELFELVIERDSVTNHEEYLLASNVLCLPSYREGFGTVVLDAAALSIPTVGSRIVGLIDSVADESTGLLFPVGDLQRMSDLLCLLNVNREMLARLGFEARRRVEEHFSTERMSHHLINFYREQLEH